MHSAAPNFVQEMIYEIAETENISQKTEHVQGFTSSLGICRIVHKVQNFQRKEM